MIRPYYLLDTNMISELMKTSPDKHVIAKMSEYENLIALPSTVWTELMFGVNTMPEGKRKDFVFTKLVDDIQSTYNIIQYDNHAAWIQADIRSRLQEIGTPVDFPDTQIASIAVSNCMILVTRNIKHFEAIQNVSPLMVENWFE
jgi:tRNA(fMet)-specific endonuclease VapC